MAVTLTITALTRKPPRAGRSEAATTAFRVERTRAKRARGSSGYTVTGKLSDC